MSLRPWLVRAPLLLLLTYGAYRASDFVAAEAQALPQRLDRIRTSSSSERAEAELSRRIPGIFDGARLIAPIFEDADYQEVPIVVVAKGWKDAGFPAVEGAVVLQHYFAPRARVRGIPLEQLQRWFQGEGPGQPDPVLVSYLDGALVSVFLGLSREEIEGLAEFARIQYGQQTILTLGKSFGDACHVVLIAALPELIRSGDPAFVRYRSLLP